MVASCFDIGALGNCADKIIMQRMNVLDEAGKITGSENVAYAWHEDPAQRKRLVAKTLQFKNDQGVMDTRQIWVDVINDNTRWDPIRAKFVDRLTNIEL